MMRLGRRLDLGAQSVEAYVATDQALLGCRRDGLIPDTLAFLHFDRPGALVGFHQSIRQEIRGEHCRALGIPIQRRITGGGALYVDDGVLGWELYLDRSSLGTAHLGDAARLLCTLAAEGLSGLGLSARYRPRNDIEVDGRKICGTGGIYDDTALLYHGSVLLEFDVGSMLEVLRIPAEKWRDKAIAQARDRVTSLREVLGRRPSVTEVSDSLARAFSNGLGIEFAVADLSATEEAARERARSEIADDAWIYQHDRPETETPVVEAVHRCNGGLLRTALLLDMRTGRIKQAWFTGDFFVHPVRLIPDLEAALKDTSVEDVRATVGHFFGRYPVDMLMLSRDDFCDAIDVALAAGQAERKSGVPM